MRTLQLPLVIALAALAACSTPHSQLAASADLFKRVSGEWAVLHEGVVRCDEGTEFISFSEDFSTARFKSSEKYALGQGKESDTITYKILKVQGNTITMSLNGETRTTAAGDLVVWSLVLVEDKVFVWRRTDWLTNQSTQPRIRCDYLDGKQPK
jgi:hypothetical protein